MSCCKKSRACDAFVSSSLLRPLGDPILHRAGNFALALSPSHLILTKRRVLQFIGAAALNDFYSRLHGSPDNQMRLDVAGFCPYRFFLETLDSASGTLLKGVIAGLPDKAIHTFEAFTKILFCRNQMIFSGVIS